MTSIKKMLNDLIGQPQKIKPGTYHYISPPDDPRNYRLHLRIEPDGSGLLIINASTILHLNQTAAEFAYYLVMNKNIDTVGKIIADRYEISQAKAVQDYQEMIDQINILLETPDLDPVTYIDFERMPPFTGHISAPYRLDCALTYRLPEGIDPAYAPSERALDELETGDWLSIIDQAASIGIPHLVFTGGEPTLRDDLLALLNRAEENNQVTGLLSTGKKLSDRVYLDDLLQTGLDHLMLLLSPDDEQSWKSLHNALTEDLYVAVHLTFTEDNILGAPKLIERLEEIGVCAVSISTNMEEQAAKLGNIRDLIASKNMDLVWNLPVPYSSMNPVELETTQIEFRSGAGRAWLYLEPDGDVLPTQGINQVLGNFLRDDWNQIWETAHQLS